MIFKQIESGGDRNYAYIIASGKTGQCALIDPSPDPFRVIKKSNEEGFIIKIIVNTHSHFDHSAGNDCFVKMSMENPAESITFINCGIDTRVPDGTVLKLGDLELEVINTPGHTEDSICIKVENKLITGDTLFVGKVGGTYSDRDAKTEFESLKKIMRLHPETEVWPGHNYGVRQSSTIGFEQSSNPFIIRLADFNDFLWLKKNWARYKQEHGIK